MNRLLLASTFLLAIAGSSVAADAVVDELPPVASGYDWSGFYVGLNAGVGHASYDGIYDSSDLDEIPPDSHILSEWLNGSGFAGGVHAGWNSQFDRWVLGVEADLSVLDIEESALEPEDGSEKATADLDTLSSLRGRAGFAMDNLLIYGTGGIAYITGDYSVEDDGDGNGSTSLDQIGLAVGGGAEWGLSERISLRAEGLYYAFNDKIDTSNLTGDSDPGDFIELEDIFVFRAGVSLHF